MSSASRCESRPLTVRRGDPWSAGVTRAWTSTSSGRLPSSVAATATPGAPSESVSRNAAAGIRDLGQAVGRHLEHADFLGRAEAVLAGSKQAQAAETLPLERQDNINEVLERLGPGQRAVLGDVADEDHRHAVFLGVRL